MDNISLLQRRLDNPQFVSDVELDARYAIDRLQASGAFVLGYVTNSEIIFFQCKTNDRQQFCIEKTTKIDHQIASLTEKISPEDIPGVNLMYPFNKDGLYSFDPFFNQYLPNGFNEHLAQQIDNNEMAREMPYYLVDEAGLLQCHAVRYALQTKASARVILMEPYDNESFRKNYRHSYILPDELESVPIQLYQEESNLERYCLDNYEWFCVPLDDKTLNATFWIDKTWRDIIPNENKDASFDGIALKYITLKTYVDGFQNIYVSVSDIQGNNKNVALKINEKNNVI